MGTFCIITYGCTHNQGDSLKIKQILLAQGYKEEKFISAEVIIINTCAVKLQTQNKILFFIDDLIEKKYSFNKLVITGCLPQISNEIFIEVKEKIKNINGIIIHPHSLYSIASLIMRDKYSEFQPLVPHEKRDKSKIIPFTDSNKKDAIIQISEGCNNQCAYCCVTHARGNLISFNLNSIIQEIKYLVKKGVVEFLITSQDIGNYLDGNNDLIDLLNEISLIKGDFHFRIGMMNPEYLKIEENLTRLLEIFNDRRFYRFLHLPIQSGSNRILKKMNRNYTSEEFKHIILMIKDFDPKFTISTDIIVGFPEESEMDYELTKNLIDELKPRILNISKYTTRPNTIAQKMKQVDSKIIKNRSIDLTKCFKEYLNEINRDWLGWEGDIFINELDLDYKYPYSGRNLHYLPILCKTGEMWGEKKVKILSYLNNSFFGE